MERTFVVIDEKTLECAVPVELNNTQEAILECKELREQIDQIAKNLQVCWDVKKYNNKSWAIVSKVIEVTSLDKQAHEVEMKAVNFMSAIGELTLPSFEQDCPTHEPANEEAEVIAEEIAFVKNIKEDLSNIRGALIMPSGIPEELVMLIGDYHTMSPTCLRRMIDAYLKEYDHE